MEKATWIAVATLTIATIVPFANSLFQHWLEKKETDNPAVKEPSAKIQAGIFPLGNIKVLSRNWRWFFVFVQWLAGAVAIMLMQMVWRPVTIAAWIALGLAVILFVAVQALPWTMRDLDIGPAAPKSRFIKRFGVLWDENQNPHCPVDKTLMSFFRHGFISDHNCDYLVCPACDKKIALFDSVLSGLTLFAAKEYIRNDLRRGQISN